MSESVLEQEQEQEHYPLPSHGELCLIHYHRVTGEIRNWGHDDGAEESFAGSDYVLARFEGHFDLDPERQKMDVATGKVVNKSEQEVIAWFLPIVKMAIFNELCATDQYMTPDRPLTEEVLDAWRTYRQTLRDLKGDAKEMLSTWPRNPVGEEPNAQLKTRLLRVLDRE